jgi:hypothetical protein
VKAKGHAQMVVGLGNPSAVHWQRRLNIEERPVVNR